MPGWLQHKNIMVEISGTKKLNSWWSGSGSGNQCESGRGQGPDTSLRSHLCDPLRHTQKCTPPIPSGYPKASQVDTPRYSPQICSQPTTSMGSTFSYSTIRDQKHLEEIFVCAECDIFPCRDSLYGVTSVRTAFSLC